ncbi:MAG: hypothetical protein LBH09_00530 [Peptococcaceae bacterium]|nr:hypothetical protein [Peptococcaceae bacterium]
MSLNLTPLREMSFFQPLLWATYISWLVFAALDWWEERRRPYRQMLYATKGDRLREGSRKDSRGLMRAMWIMDRGARIMRVDQSYWDKLDRRLAMMGEKAGAKEMTAILLLRSLLLSLPILALSLLWADLRIAAAYPLTVALLFRQEMKVIDRKFAQWQQELARGIPEVMDHLRICFAGGRDYLSALRQAQSSGSPATGRALSRLILDIQSIGSAGAFRLFSVSFDLPAIQKLASALMLAVESGYGAAEAYFSSIEDELTALRQEAAESLIRAKPEKIYQLYALLFILAVAALVLKGWEVLNQVGRLFT